MKKLIPFLLGMTLLLASCTNHSDSLIGDWVVEKVNVQFDENRSTPELVKQIGEMEKQNAFSINADSLLVFKGLDETWQEQVKLKNGDKLYCGDDLFGTWRENMIVTRILSPIGEIVVTYRKK